MIRAYVLGIVTGAFATAALVLAVPAEADTDKAVVAYAAMFAGAVCTTLDAYPSFEGIQGIGAAIMDDGLSARQAGQVIGLSVIEACPRHYGLMQSFINANQQVVA